MPCPQCGQQSEVIPGRYDTGEDRLDVLIDPSISQEALTAIRDIIVRLQKGEIDELQAKAEVKKTAPKAARLFDVKNLSVDTKIALFAAAMSAIAILQNASSDKGTTHNDNSTYNTYITEQVVPSSKPNTFKDDLKNSSAFVPFPRPKPQEFE